MFCVCLRDVPDRHLKDTLSGRLVANIGTVIHPLLPSVRRTR